MSELETHYSQEDTKICPEQPHDLENSIDSQNNADSPVTSPVREELSSRIDKTSTGRERLIRSHSSARFCFELSGNLN